MRVTHYLFAQPVPRALDFFLSQWEEVRYGLDLRPALSRFPWLSSVLPTPERVAQLLELSRDCGVGSAWFSWYERGDDLYCDAALVFDSSARKQLKPWLSFTLAEAGQFLFVRQTYLMGGRGGSAGYALHARRPLRGWKGAPLQEAMLRLGAAAIQEYFVPGDQRHFDWEPYRLARPGVTGG
jgi:hypothetical protein